MTELCLRFGISRPIGYKWVKRYKEEGLPGLEERSHAPHRHPQTLDADIVARLFAARRQHPTWGPKKLLAWLERIDGQRLACAPSTAAKWLRQAGLSEARVVRPRNVAYRDPLGSFSGANEVWCVDFKGHFRLGNGSRCVPLTLTDGYSRYLLRCEALARAELASTRRVLEAAFREYGLPRRLRSDNGTPFSSLAVRGISALGVWLIRLGVVPERIAPGKPYQNGRHERMHLTLNEAIKPPAATLRGQQRRFTAFRRCFNHERPHEALGQQPPASVYEPSPRAMPRRVPEPEYASEVFTRRVQFNGLFHWEGDEWFLSESLRGQTIGLEPVGEERWRIWFCHYALGVLDRKVGKIVADTTT